MKIQHEVDGGHAKATVSGRIDVMTAPEFEKTVMEILPGTQTVDIDLAGVDYISSAGLRALMALKRKAEGQQTVLNILNPSASVMDIFALTGFDNVLNLKKDGAQ